MFAQEHCPAFYVPEEMARGDLIREGVRWLAAWTRNSGGEGLVVASTRDHFGRDPALIQAVNEFRTETPQTMHRAYWEGGGGAGRVAHDADAGGAR